MKDRCRREARPPLLRYVIMLSVVCLLPSCKGMYDTELVIEACEDQDGNLLPPGVLVTVDGVSEIWNGEPLRFPIKVKGDVKLVTVEAGAKGGYVFNSKPQYAVPPGKMTKTTLHFFKPYNVTIEAFGQEMTRLSGVDVYANGQRVGTTDEHGRFLWRIDQPLTRAGSVRPGTRFHIWLECNGQSVEALPVTFKEAQFTYTIWAQLESLRTRSETGKCSYFSNVPSLSQLS